MMNIHKPELTPTPSMEYDSIINELTGSYRIGSYRIIPSRHHHPGNGKYHVRPDGDRKAHFFPFFFHRLISRELFAHYGVPENVRHFLTFHLSLCINLFSLSRAPFHHPGEESGGQFCDFMPWCNPSHPGRCGTFDQAAKGSSTAETHRWENLMYHMEESGPEQR